jgi:DNA-binding IclR family transcriptional regulator
LTITDPAALREELRLTRIRGYAINDGESQPGVSGVGLPVFNPDGVFLGAVSVAGPSERMRDVERLVAIVRKCLELSPLRTDSPKA